MQEPPEIAGYRARFVEEPTIDFFEETLKNGVADGTLALEDEDDEDVYAESVGEVFNLDGAGDSGEEDGKYNYSVFRLDSMADSVSDYFNSTPA